MNCCPNCGKPWKGGYVDCQCSVVSGPGTIRFDPVECKDSDGLSPAERIVWHLSGPGSLDEWRERLPNRPDWSAAIELVQEILDEVK